MEKIEITPENFNRIKHLLPPRVIELETLMGMEATCILINRYGGGAIPSTLNKTECGKASFAHYVELLGEKAATRLKDGIFQYNRQESSYIIPRCNKALRYLRDEKMRADFDRLTESKSSVEAVNILTRDYGLCCRQVWYILKGY